MNVSNCRRTLMGNTFREEMFAETDLRAARAFGSIWTKCSFRDCNFDASNFSGATFVDCKFAECSFQNVNLSGAKITDCQFYDCDMTQSDMSSAILRGVAFSGCVMLYSSFVDASVWETRFSDSNLSGALMLYAQSKDIDYRGANLHNVAMRFGCLFFKDATFDEKQWQMFQAMVGHVRGVESLQDKVVETLNPAIVRMVNTMFDSQETH